jgi:catechol 2,3-dioxygenase-like lactoylglutathione lyase family enzyme
MRRTPSQSVWLRAPALLIASQLRVRDLAVSRRFYRVLGLRPLAHGLMADGERLLWLGDRLTHQIVELYSVPPGSRFHERRRPPPRYHTPLLFAVNNPDRLCAALLRAGGRLPVDFEEGEVRIRFVRDPDGHLVELVGWRTARPGPPPLVSLLRRVRGTRQGRGRGRPAAARGRPARTVRRPRGR